MQLVSGHLAAELVRVQINKRAQAEQSPRALRRPAGDPEEAMPAKKLHPAEAADDAQSATIFVIDDDDMVRDYVRLLLELEGRTVEAYASSEAFLAAYRPHLTGSPLIVAGHLNKEIAWRLGISQRTVENHRATVMKKSGAKSLPDLIHLVMKSVPTASFGQRGTATRVKLMPRRSQAEISAHAEG